MSKLLTQEEIDALLSAEEGGQKEQNIVEEPKKEYRLYDFRRPDRVSKDQQKFLRNIHENFAKLLSTYLSNSMRQMIDVKSPIIDQVTYLEFTMSSSDFTNMYLFEIENLDGKAILEVDPNLTYFVIDRVFGGTGTIINRGNTITTIERSVMNGIATQILANFQEAWKHVDKLIPKIVAFETNPQLVTIAPSSETMLILNFPIVVKNYDFYIYLCFPYFMMEPVLKKLISQTYMSLLKKQISDEDLQNITHNIEQSYIDLIVELGHTNISVEEFVELRPGDIITLDNTINELTLGKLAENKKFLGTVGNSNKKAAYRIEYLLDDEGEILR